MWSFTGGYMNMISKGSTRTMDLLPLRKIAGCACAGNAENVFPRHRLQRKPQISDPGMHHVTCVTHVPWCMSGSLTRDGEGNVPGFPGACTTRNYTYLVRYPWLSIRVVVNRRWSFTRGHINMISKDNTRTMEQFVFVVSSAFTAHMIWAFWSQVTYAVEPTY